jgi:uncharacterized cupredoxin-like copper-binding protein
MSKEYKITTDEDLEKVEEDIIRAANKAGKKNVIVNIFTYPHKKLKKRWHVRYKFNKKHLMMDLLIAAGVLVLVGLNIFWLYGGFHYFSNKLDVEISSPLEMISGAEVEFIIDYENKNKYELEEVIMSLRLPEYFELAEVSREEYDLEHNTLELGNLAPGANGEIIVRGQLIGEYESEQYLVANFNFYKTNKKGERLWGQFSKNKVERFMISGSYLEIETELPDNLVNNQVFDWPIIIKNTSEALIYEQIRFEPEYDSEFINFGLAPVQIQNFGPGQEKEIKLSVRVSTASENKDLALKVFWFVNGVELNQFTWAKEQPVFKPKFLFEAEIGSGVAVNPGEPVELNIKYQNAGRFTIENVSLTLDLLSDYWTLSGVEGDVGKIQANKIIWNAQQIPRLALLQPGESGEIALKIKTRSYVSGSADVDLQSRLKTNFKVEGQEVELIGPTVSAKLNSNLMVSAYPMYYARTGDQLGRGPIPPYAGEETKYWLFARMVNDINAVDNVRFSAELPFNVTYTGKGSVPVGDPIKVDGKEISWQISQVPVKPSNIGFALELAIVPTASQVGTYPLLLQNMQISGIDTVTGEQITKNLGSVNTKLTNDKRGLLRDGKVRQ